jgi:hypothetical protein
MTGLRRPFGLLLGVCYLWVIVSQLVMLCPCQGHSKTARTGESPIEAANCCSSETYPTCCETQEVESPGATSEVELPDECCPPQLNCHNCPFCLSSVLAVPANDKASSIDPTFKATAIDFCRIEIAVYSDYSSAVDHPPDRIRIAPHISTTVLRC